MTNYEINWQAMAPGPYLSEKYQWSLDMSESDISCNSSPVGSNSMGSYQSSPTDSTWDYIPLVEKALGTMPMDELFPEPNLGNHQELLNYDYCDNPLASKNASTLPLDLIADINNFTLPDTVDPMSNEDTTKFDLTQFLCDDNNQDAFEEKFSIDEHYQVEVTLQATQEPKIEPKEEEEERTKPLSIKEEPIVDSDTEIDVESVPEDYKPFFEPEEIDYQVLSRKRLKESVKKVNKKLSRPKFKRKGSADVIHQAKTIPSITVGKKDVKQSAINNIVSIDSKKNVECKKSNVPYKSVPPQNAVEKISPPAIIEASDAIGLLDQLEMFDMIKDEVKAKKPLSKQTPQRRTIAVEALPQSSKRSKVQKPKRGKELGMKSIEACQQKVMPPVLEEKDIKIIVDSKKEVGEKKKVNMQPIRTLKEIPVINPQDWLYTPQKSSTSNKPKPPIAKLKLVRSLPEGQSGQQISAAVLQQLQEKTKNKKIIVTQMLPIWKVEKPTKSNLPTKTNLPTKSVLRANPRSLVQISSSPSLKLPSRAVEISTQTDQPVETKKLITQVPVVKREVPPAKKPGCWKVDHDYLNGASLVKPNYKSPMVSILKANVNKIKTIDHSRIDQARIDYASTQKIKIEVQDVQQVQHKRKAIDDNCVQPRKVLKLEDYKQRKPIKYIVKQEPREELITEGITLPPFVHPASITVKTEAVEAVKEEHPYVAPPPIPNHLQMMVSRGVNTSQSWAHLEQMAKNHGLQFSCNSLISSMLEQLPENDISDKIFEDVVVSFDAKKKEKVETREIGVQVGTISINKRNRSQSPTPSLLSAYKSQGRWWGNRPRTFRDIIQSVMERRVVFVGGIREGTTNAQLASLFVRFGEIEHTNIIYEKKWQDGPDYCGFVTFKTADIAYEVIGKGNHYHGLEHFQLNFGGRRLFLQTPGYSDLDNMRDEMYVQQNYKESFSEALQVTRRLLKKQGKIS